MTSYLLAGPAAEPVSLAEAKVFLKVDDAAEDALIATLITAARLHVEGVTGKALMHQTWRMVRDGWPKDRTVKLPVTPFASLVAVTAYDEAGTGHAVPLAQFMSAPDRLLLPATLAGLPLMRDRQGIEIDYVAGFGSEPGDVPVDIRQALLTLMAHWHEHRDAVIVAGSGTVVPTGFDRLIAPHRRVAL
ncbi:hypothetical protein VE25_07215 [Devosia geojensis]|uniref:PhiE125 gp8 family phage protein n=1 Tax=Devosia geojensis TaxID=443610 RepID=A0A0F5FUE8_9HYPH|nr:phage head-tail connector protein [Devosia geojensis]KKB12458.1 hypothetical protein VE25_07215 [Devosia geojensis]